MLLVDSFKPAGHTVPQNACPNLLISNPGIVVMMWRALLRRRDRGHTLDRPL